MEREPERPPEVRAAEALAQAGGFALSCEPVAGRTLAVLAGAVPRDGRILELGTGAGVGLAWIVSGLAGRRDVEVVSVDLHPAVQALARDGDWPPNLRFELGDGAVLASQLGAFDLIFADAPGGKLENLEGTVAALAPRGVLLVDDMDLAQHDDPALCRQLTTVRQTLRADPRLTCSELAAGSGLLLASRRETPDA